ncbi:MAG: LysE family translocator, partial [Desulfobacterales bacterium]|nr:LysE family translocator [Desulfobacterales bacterium]
WLGVKLWLTKPVPPGDKPGTKMQSGKQRFLGGLFITLGNPKAILFYVGFLPTFMDLGSLTTGDVLVVACLVTVVLALVMGVYAYFASRARTVFTKPRALRNLNRGAGTIMIGAGAVIATR